VLASLTSVLTSEIVKYGYVAVFLLMVLESACIPVPSEVTMLFGGALTTTAVAGSGNELNLLLVVLAGTAGNLVGSWLSYWAGAAGGRPFTRRFGRYLLIRPHEVERAHEWFERRGEVAVFAGRLLPVVRTFISLPAGVARMNVAKFTFYTVLGCAPFVFGLTWLGARAGERWTRVEHTLQPFSLLIAAAVVVAGAVYVYRRWSTVRREYAVLDAAAAPERVGADDD
jgi:membrane protein DedA with SNARE-associated domain